MELFDAHNHLQDERLAADLEGVVSRARGAGVAGMMCCGSSEADWSRVGELARRFPGVLPSFGLHPWYVRERSDRWLKELEEHLDSQLSGVGEIGLDHALEPRDDADQEDVFLRQLQLSRARAVPVSIHCRRAWGRLMELLRAAGPHPAGMVLHSYSGGDALVPELAGLNAYFSFSGSLTFPGNKRGPRALRAVPEDRLLLETDAPDIPPAERRTPEDPAPLNEPAHLLYTLRAAARHLQRPEKEVGRLALANSRRLFGPLMGSAPP